MENEIKETQDLKEAVNKNTNNEMNFNNDKVKEIINKINPYLKRIRENRKKVVIINLIITAILFLYIFFIVEPYYESKLVILPEFGSKSTSIGGLSDLASLAGVDINNGSATEIYENLVKSEAVLESVIRRKYQTEEFSEPVNLVDYLEVDNDESLDPVSNERYRFLEAYEVMIKSKIETSFERLTKILTISVKMPESQLTADVANAVVESLDDYIRNKRKSFASQQCFYIEKRINQVRDSLVIIENQLKEFREQNRIIAQSPKLLLEEVRLKRNFEIQQTVFIELTKQLEIAKIDEIKETPIINVREEAKNSIIKAGPPKAKIIIVVLLLSFAVTVGYFIFAPHLQQYKLMLKQSLEN